MKYLTTFNYYLQVLLRHLKPFYLFLIRFLNAQFLLFTTLFKKQSDKLDNPNLGLWSFSLLFNPLVNFATYVFFLNFTFNSIIKPLWFILQAKIWAEDTLIVYKLFATARFFTILFYKVLTLYKKLLTSGCKNIRNIFVKKDELLTYHQLYLLWSLSVVDFVLELSTAVLTFIMMLLRYDYKKLIHFLFQLVYYRIFEIYFILSFGFYHHLNVTTTCISYFQTFRNKILNKRKPFIFHYSLDDIYFLVKSMRNFLFSAGSVRLQDMNISEFIELSYPLSSGSKDLLLRGVYGNDNYFFWSMLRIADYDMVSVLEKYIKFPRYLVPANSKEPTPHLDQVVTWIKQTVNETPDKSVAQNILNEFYYVFFEHFQMSILDELKRDPYALVRLKLSGPYLNKPQSNIFFSEYLYDTALLESICEHWTFMEIANKTYLISKEMIVNPTLVTNEKDYYTIVDHEKHYLLFTQFIEVFILKFYMYFTAYKMFAFNLDRPLNFWEKFAQTLPLFATPWSFPYQDVFIWPCALVYYAIFVFYIKMAVMPLMYKSDEFLQWYPPYMEFFRWRKDTAEYFGPDLSIDHDEDFLIYNIITWYCIARYADPNSVVYGRKRFKLRYDIEYTRLLKKLRRTKRIDLNEDYYKLDSGLFGYNTRLTNKGPTAHHNKLYYADSKMRVSALTDLSPLLPMYNTKSMVSRFTRRLRANPRFGEYYPINISKYHLAKKVGKRIRKGLWGGFGFYENLWVSSKGLIDKIPDTFYKNNMYGYPIGNYYSSYMFLLRNNYPMRVTELQKVKLAEKTPGIPINRYLKTHTASILAGFWTKKEKRDVSRLLYIIPKKRGSNIEKIQHDLPQLRAQCQQRLSDFLYNIDRKIRLSKFCQLTLTDEVFLENLAKTCYRFEIKNNTRPTNTFTRYLIKTWYDRFGPKPQVDPVYEWNKTLFQRLDDFMTPPMKRYFFSYVNRLQPFLNFDLVGNFDYLESDRPEAIIHELPIPYHLLTRMANFLDRKSYNDHELDQIVKKRQKLRNPKSYELQEVVQTDDQVLEKLFRPQTVGGLGLEGVRDSIHKFVIQPQETNNVYNRWLKMKAKKVISSINKSSAIPKGIAEQNAVYTFRELPYSAAEWPNYYQQAYEKLKEKSNLNKKLQDYYVVLQPSTMVMHTKKKKSLDYWGKGFFVRRIYKVQSWFANLRIFNFSISRKLVKFFGLKDHSIYQAFDNHNLRVQVAYKHDIYKGPSYAAARRSVIRQSRYEMCGLRDRYLRNFFGSFGFLPPYDVEAGKILDVAEAIDKKVPDTLKKELVVLPTIEIDKHKVSPLREDGKLYLESSLDWVLAQPIQVQGTARLIGSVADELLYTTKYRRGVIDNHYTKLSSFEAVHDWYNLDIKAFPLIRNIYGGNRKTSESELFETIDDTYRLIPFRMLDQNIGEIAPSLEDPYMHYIMSKRRISSKSFIEHFKNLDNEYIEALSYPTKLNQIPSIPTSHTWSDTLIRLEGITRVATRPRYSDINKLNREPLRVTSPIALMQAETGHNLKTALDFLYKQKGDAVKFAISSTYLDIMTGLLYRERSFSTHLWTRIKPEIREYFMTDLDRFRTLRNMNFSFSVDLYERYSHAFTKIRLEPGVTAAKFGPELANKRKERYQTLLKEFEKKEIYWNKFFPGIITPETSFHNLFNKFGESYLKGKNHPFLKTKPTKNTPYYMDLVNILSNIKDPSEKINIITGILQSNIIDKRSGVWFDFLFNDIAHNLRFLDQEPELFDYEQFNMACESYLPGSILSPRTLRNFFIDLNKYRTDSINLKEFYKTFLLFVESYYKELKRGQRGLQKYDKKLKVLYYYVLGDEMPEKFQTVENLIDCIYLTDEERLWLEDIFYEYEVPPVYYPDSGSFTRRTDPALLARRPTRTLMRWYENINYNLTPLDNTYTSALDAFLAKISYQSEAKGRSWLEKFKYFFYGVEPYRLYAAGYPFYISGHVSGNLTTDYDDLSAVQGTSGLKSARQLINEAHAVRTIPKQINQPILKMLNETYKVCKAAREDMIESTIIMPAENWDSTVDLKGTANNYIRKYMTIDRLLKQHYMINMQPIKRFFPHFLRMREDFRRQEVYRLFNEVESKTPVSVPRIEKMLAAEISQQVILPNLDKELENVQRCPLNDFLLHAPNSLNYTYAPESRDIYISPLQERERARFYKEQALLDLQNHIYKEYSGLYRKFDREQALGPLSFELVGLKAFRELELYVSEKGYFQGPQKLLTNNVDAWIGFDTKTEAQFLDFIDNDIDSPLVKALKADSYLTYKSEDEVYDYTFLLDRLCHAFAFSYKKQRFGPVTPKNVIWPNYVDIKGSKQPRLAARLGRNHEFGRVYTKTYIQPKDRRMDETRFSEVGYHERFYNPKWEVPNDVPKNLNWAHMSFFRHPGHKKRYDLLTYQANRRLQKYTPHTSLHMSVGRHLAELKERSRFGVGITKQLGFEGFESWYYCYYDGVFENFGTEFVRLPDVMIDYFKPEDFFLDRTKIRPNLRQLHDQWLLAGFYNSTQLTGKLDQLIQNTDAGIPLHMYSTYSFAQFCARTKDWFDVYDPVTERVVTNYGSQSVLRQGGLFLKRYYGYTRPVDVHYQVSGVSGLIDNIDSIASGFFEMERAVGLEFALNQFLVKYFGIVPYQIFEYLVYVSYWGHNWLQAIYHGSFIESHVQQLSGHRVTDGLLDLGFDTKLFDIHRRRAIKEHFYDKHVLKQEFESFLINNVKHKEGCVISYPYYLSLTIPGRTVDIDITLPVRSNQLTENNFLLLSKARYLDMSDFDFYTLLQEFEQKILNTPDFKDPDNFYSSIYSKMLIEHDRRSKLGKFPMQGYERRQWIKKHGRNW